ncbi:MAG: hypothetical protein ACOH5I_15325 [Oligoflexus sp.]
MEDLRTTDFEALRAALDEDQIKKVDDRYRKNCQLNRQRPRLNALIGGREAPYSYQDLIAFIPKKIGGLRWSIFYASLFALLLAGGGLGFIMIDSNEKNVKIMLAAVEVGLLIAAAAGASMRWSGLYIFPMLFVSHQILMNEAKENVKSLTAAHDLFRDELRIARKNLDNARSQLQVERIRCDPNNPFNCRIYDSGTAPLRELISSFESREIEAQKRLLEFEDRHLVDLQVRSPEMSRKSYISTMISTGLRFSVMLILFYLSHNLRKILHPGL